MSASASLSPTSSKIPPFSDLQNLDQLLSSGNLDQLVHAYLEIMKKPPNDVDALSKKVFETLQTYTNFKEKLQAYIVSLPDSQKKGACCTLLTAIYKLRSYHNLARQIFDIVIENRIVLDDAQYYPLVNLLTHYYISKDNIKDSRNGNLDSKELIGKSYQAIAIGDKPEMPMLTFFLIHAKGTVEQDKGTLNKVICKKLECAFYLNNSEYIKACILAIAFNDLFQPIFDTDPNLRQPITKYLVNELENPNRLIPQEMILRFLNYWPPTASLEVFAKTVLSVVNNVDTTFVWLIKSLSIEDHSLLTNLFNVLKHQKVHQNLEVKKRLMGLFLETLRNKKELYRDILLKTIQSFPKLEKDKFYLCEILDVFLDSLSTASTNRWSNTDLQHVFLLLDYGLNISETPEFSSKCLTFIQQHQLEMYIPTSIDLRKLMNTPFEIVIVQGRTIAKKMPQNKELRDFICNPHQKIDFLDSKGIVANYIEAMELGVFGFFEFSIPLLKRMFFTSSCKEMYAATPTAKKDVLVHFFIRAFYSLIRIRKEITDDAFCMKSRVQGKTTADLRKIEEDNNKAYELAGELYLQQKPHLRDLFKELDLREIRFKDLDIALITTSILKDIKEHFPTVKHFDLTGCKLDQNVLKELSQFDIEKVSVDGTNIEDIILPKTINSIRFTGNINKILPKLATVPLKSLELVDCTCESSILEGCRGKPISGSLRELALIRLGPLNPSPRLLSNLFPNLKKLELTGFEWTSGLEPFREYFISMRNTLASFSFKFDNVEITLDFIFMLKVLNLESLGLSGKVTDALVRRISEICPDLNVLELPNNSLTDNCFEHIKTFLALRRLDISKNPCIRSLKSFLPNSGDILSQANLLTSLNISQTGLRSEEILVLARPKEQRNLKGLQELKIGLRYSPDADLSEDQLATYLSTFYTTYCDYSFTRYQHPLKV